MSRRPAMFQAAMLRAAGVLLAACAGSSVTGCAEQHPRGSKSDQPSTTPRDTPSDTPATDAMVPLPIDEKAHVGAQGFVRLAALESAGPPPSPELGSVEGKATFTETSSGVDMELGMGGCVPGISYVLSIVQGSDCTAASLRGPSWDAPRGEGIADANCNLSAGGPGRSIYTRAKSHAKPWSIGTPKASNLLGHAMLISDPTGKPLACGVITRTPDLPTAPKPTGAAAKPELSSFLAGICLLKTFTRDSVRTCPDPVELSRCSREHCELDQCAQACSTFLTCLDSTDDPCVGEFDCEMTQECSDCRNDVGSCTFKFCPEQVACAPPTTPDGPCAKLEACCAMQGDKTPQCLDIVRALEKFSGDVSCEGAMRDLDIIQHFNVPCRFE